MDNKGQDIKEIKDSSGVYHKLDADKLGGYESSHYATQSDISGISDDITELKNKECYLEYDENQQSVILKHNTGDGNTAGDGNGSGSGNTSGGGNIDLLEAESVLASYFESHIGDVQALLKDNERRIDDALKENELTLMAGYAELDIRIKNLEK